MEDDMSMKLFTTLLTAGCLLMVPAVWAQTDPIGKVDTVTLNVEALAAGKWMVSAHVWHDEPLAAIDIPIKYSAGMAKLFIDSVSFKGTRMENFAQKYSPVDTAGQVMHFGGLAYMGPDKPPLAPGSGEVARVYISAKGGKEPGAFAIDTTTAQPNSSLMLVDEKAKIIVPDLKIITVKKEEAPKGEKK
jgi:hypothetical protein